MFCIPRRTETNIFPYKGSGSLVLFSLTNSDTCLWRHRYFGYIKLIDFCDIKRAEISVFFSYKGSGSLVLFSLANSDTCLWRHRHRHENSLPLRGRLNLSCTGTYYYFPQPQPKPKPVPLPPLLQQHIHTRSKGSKHSQLQSLSKIPSRQPPPQQVTRSIISLQR